MYVCMYARGCSDSRVPTHIRIPSEEEADDNIYTYAWSTPNLPSFLGPRSVCRFLREMQILKLLLFLLRYVLHSVLPSMAMKGDNHTPTTATEPSSSAAPSTMMRHMHSDVSVVKTQTDECEPLDNDDPAA